MRQQQPLMEMVNDSSHPVWRKVYRRVPESRIRAAALSGDKGCPECDKLVPGYRLVRGSWQLCHCQAARKVAREIDRALGLRDGCDMNAGILQ